MVYRDWNGGGHVAPRNPEADIIAYCAEQVRDRKAHPLVFIVNEIDYALIADACLRRSGHRTGGLGHRPHVLVPTYEGIVWIYKGDVGIPTAGAR